MNRMLSATRLFVTSASGALALPVLVAFGLVLLGVPIAVQAQSTVTYRFCVYDTGEQDGDRIDLTVDSEEIISDQELLHAEHCVRKHVRLRVATNLTVKALNTGDSVDNTGALVIRNAHGVSLAERRWQLRQDKFALWTIWAISEDEVSFVAPVDQRPPASDHQRETVHETVAAVAAATVSNVTSNIGARFSAPTGGATVSLAGTPVAFGPASSKSSGSVWLPDRFDVRTGDTWQARHRTMTGSDFLPSTSFEIALGASAGDKDLPIDASNRLTVWGRGDFQIFESGGGRKSGYDGHLLAGYLGADLAMDRGWLAGLAISRIAAEADYTLGRAGGGGTLEAVLTNVHPYVRVAIGAKTEAWAILGLGTGEITNVTQQTTSKTDMSMKMVSAGGRHGIASGGGVDLAILADGSSAVVETDAGVRAIDGISANVWRARLGAEASYTIDWDDGSALTSFLEVAGRKDGGDSTRGVGLEISPGLAFSHPESGLAVEARGRVLALHSADNHREYGASITVSKAPSAGGLGLSMAITPILGTPDGTLNAASAPLFPAEAADRLSDSLSLNSRLAYGVAVGKGVLTPFVDFSLRDGDSRRIRIGSRYSFGPSVEVELAGDRLESASESLEHIVQFSGRIRF